MKFERFFYIPVVLVFLFVASCSGGKEKPSPRAEVNFLTLADVSGRTSFTEDSPDIRVIKNKAKALIKRDDIRAAQKTALANASKMAVNAMVQELLPAEKYNRHFAEIEKYLSSNIDKFIVAKEINGRKKIYLDQFMGIAASFKISRQKVLVALQKDLGLIDKSSGTLITVVTSKKDLDLSGMGFRFSDIEDALMNQIQTDLNQRGLHAMDFRNAITSFKGDKGKYEAYANLSKDQFMSMVAGSKAADVALNSQIEDAEAFYSTGLTLLKQLAKVVVEINILAVNQTNNNLVLNLGVTAKNISTARGGAFANSIIQVARKGGPNTDPAAMLTGLIKDTYMDMNKEFIPQVLKEMSTIDVKGNKLSPYQLVFKGFDDFRNVRRGIEGNESDDFRYIDYDNTLSRAEPSINIVLVRYSKKLSNLGDMVLDILDGLKLKAREPLVAPGVNDLVFEKIND